MKNMKAAYNMYVGTRMRTPKPCCNLEGREERGVECKRRRRRPVESRQRRRARWCQWALTSAAAAPRESGRSARHLMAVRGGGPRGSYPRPDASNWASLSLVLARSLPGSESGSGRQAHGPLQFQSSSNLNDRFFIRSITKTPPHSSSV